MSTRRAFDIAILNVECHTMNKERPMVEAIGIEGDHISCVGSSAEIKAGVSSMTHQIDGQGKVLLPGFVDAHSHFASMGVRMTEYLDLGAVQSKAELLQHVKKTAKTKEKDKWVVGVNWDESKWKGDREFMTKEELDEISPDNPVTLERVDGHISCVNSKTLAILDLDPSIKGFEIVDGEPTGRLMEEARFKIRKETEPDVEGVMQGIQEATKKAHALGVTSIHDAWVDKKKFKAYQKLWKEDKLNIRTTLFFPHEYLDDMIDLGLCTGIGDAMLRIGGLKLFSDGSIGAKTAWVTEGYRDDPENKGIPIWEPKELEDLISKAHYNDIQVVAHAIGDRAVTEVIRCFEAAQTEEKKNLRHRIEHCEMITREQIEKMRNLGIIASMQPNFIGEWGKPGGMYEDRLGTARMETMDPFRWFLEEGVPLAFGSDSMPFDPFYGIHSAVNAPFESQKLSPGEAIRAYTVSAAFAGFSEEEAGSITEGKLADLVLLDGNPFEEPDGIREMSPQLTIFNGEVVYAKD